MPDHHDPAAVFAAIQSLAKQWDDGEARYWVNDSGPVLSGTLHGKDYRDTVVGLVGIVDEKIGGMIMFAEPKIADEICDRLNVLDSVGRLVAALNPVSVELKPDATPET